MAVTHVEVLGRLLYVERVTRTARRSWKDRVVSYQLWTGDPYDHHEYMLGEGPSLREAIAHARAAAEVRPGQFSRAPVARRP